MEDFVLSCLESRVEKNRNLYARFLLGPFLKGQALTVGTALRRALLSSVESVGITAISIQGIAHEFSTIPGVRESVLELSLNFQKVVLCYQKDISASKKFSEGVHVGYLQAQGPKTVYANDLKLPLGIGCVDPTQYIATLSTKGLLVVKLLIGKANNVVAEKGDNALFSGGSYGWCKARSANTSQRKQSFERFEGFAGDTSPALMRRSAKVQGQDLTDYNRRSTLRDTLQSFVYKRQGETNAEQSNRLLANACRNKAWLSLRKMQSQERTKVYTFGQDKVLYMPFSPENRHANKNSFSNSLRRSTFATTLCTSLSLPAICKLNDSVIVRNSKGAKSTQVFAQLGFAGDGNGTDNFDRAFRHFTNGRFVSHHQLQQRRALLESKFNAKLSFVRDRVAQSLVLQHYQSLKKKTKLFTCLQDKTLYVPRRTSQSAFGYKPIKQDFVGNRARYEQPDSVLEKNDAFAIFKAQSILKAKKVSRLSQTHFFSKPFLSVDNRIELTKHSLYGLQTQSKHLQHKHRIPNKKHQLQTKDDAAISRNTSKKEKTEFFKSDLCFRNIIPLDFALTPINQVNFIIETDNEAIHLYDQVRERIVLEVWTNGSIHPRQAVHQATLSLIDIFSALRATMNFNKLIKL